MLTLIEYEHLGQFLVGREVLALRSDVNRAACLRFVDHVGSTQYDSAVNLRELFRRRVSGSR